MKRYQVFISSTYADLQLERQAVLESVLKLRHIPVGMEHFVSANEEQFNYIKRLLDETDYYIVIIGNRYGSQADDGISYTEKEFDYAVDLGIPIIACIHSNPDSIPVNKSDMEPDAKQKLSEFRKKVMNHRIVSYFSWDNPSNLSAEVVVALVNTINDYPRPGWERITSYENSDLLNQINDLRIENDNLRIENDRMKSLRDNQKKLKLEKNEKLIMKFPWSEVFTFMGHSDWSDYYKNISIPVSLTRLQIFSIMGPILLDNNSKMSVHFELDKALFLDKTPQFHVPDTDFNLILVEFFSYGIININKQKITLTEAGKRYLNENLNTIKDSAKKELEIIHAQIIEIIDNPFRKSHREISEYIRRLSEFNSNPEALNYIGETLLSLRVFLGNQAEWDREQVKIAQKIIKEILDEASESDRIEMGAFDPIFNLSKIRELIDFLIIKLEEVETRL